MNPTNSKKAGLQSRKKSKQYFTVLCIIQVLLNIVTYRICTEMLEIYKTAKLLPIGWFFLCGHTHQQHIDFILFSQGKQQQYCIFICILVHSPYTAPIPTADPDVFIYPAHRPILCAFLQYMGLCAHTKTCFMGEAFTFDFNYRYLCGFLYSLIGISYPALPDMEGCLNKRSDMACLLTLIILRR